MEWQNIETAPKDGTRILVIGGLWDKVEIALADGEWWSMRRKQGASGPPTHWMPLPPPPYATFADSDGDDGA